MGKSFKIPIVFDMSKDRFYVSSPLFSFDFPDFREQILSGLLLVPFKRVISLYDAVVPSFKAGAPQRTAAAIPRLILAACLMVSGFSGSIAVT